jgi:UDPglucose--hexose-1-phosphate uridylyltransferase
MNELRCDPITGRWIITFLDKIPAPSSLKAAEQPKKNGKDDCPFCYGKEDLTPHEITAHRKQGGPNTPGWSVRVVPNKYPALRVEGEITKEGDGVFDMMSGVGAHEIIVESPDHYKDMADFSYVEMEDVVWAYLSRSLDLKQDKRFKYILIFKNYGKIAGASLEHAHSQLIALPIVPKRVQEELEGATKYYDYKERCIFCDIIRQEKEEKERIIYEDERFLAFCPYVSRFPYEVWVLPKRHSADFTGLERDSVGCLARAMRDSLARIKKLLSDPPYNFIIHTSPIEGHDREDFHWHIEIMPKLTKVAGFEWGSGFYINPVPPHIAAANLLSVNIERK